MSTEKITAFPEITVAIIEGDEVTSVTQAFYEIDEVKSQIEAGIKTVRKYQESGYFNLAPPDFINDVITNFTDLELTKKDVIRSNVFMDVQGYQECNRVWQLPDEMKVQVSQMLRGFNVTYDTEHWEDFSVEPIEK